LVADLQKTVEWANSNGLRWAFTSTNAGSYYFEDYGDLCKLDKIDWQAVQTDQWSDPEIKLKKQAEFLIEQRFPLELVEEIGVYSSHQQSQVQGLFGAAREAAFVKVQRSWYY
jgi:hypothetical protein